jgi:hypothetical protein
MYSPPTIDDKRTENEPRAVERNNGANEFHGATEGTLATMTYGTLPDQLQAELNQNSTAVEILLERTTPTVAGST